MKVKFSNKVFEVLYTMEAAGLTMYAVEDEPNHIDWLTNVEVVDSEKKELKKIEADELTKFEEALFTAFSDGWQQYLHGKEVNVAQWAKEHSAELLKVARQNFTAWSEEDEKVIHCLEYTVKHFYEDEDTIKWCCEWLKSLKDKYTWKPSDIQMKALKEECDKYWEPDGLDPLYTLYQDLKKLKGE